MQIDIFFVNLQFKVRRRILSLIDAIILMLGIGGLVLGYMRGLVKQICSILGVVLGLVACNVLGGWATDVLVAVVPESKDWTMSEVTTSVVAHIVVFAIVSLGIGVAGTMMKNGMKKIHIGGADKVGGAAFGAFKYLLGLSVLLNVWWSVAPGSDMFSARHWMNNVPFETTLDMAPCMLGAETMPSDSLKAHDDAATERDSAAVAWKETKTLIG